MKTKERNTITEIWDDDCGWKHYCDSCNRFLGFLVKRVKDPDAGYLRHTITCPHCKTELTGIERC